MSPDPVLAYLERAMWRALAFLDVRVDVLTREEAARELMGVPVTFRWHPVIVEKEAPYAGGEK